MLAMIIKTEDKTIGKNMKLLEKLRALRTENNLTNQIQANHYDYANENNVDSYGIGAAMVQDVARYEFLEVMNLKTEPAAY